ncbi:MAG: aspartate aminotransferase family protein [Pseudomonadota bacterium]|nr:aspartate aminotransferase family protein [Pseudomonadota bacterium]
MTEHLMSTYARLPVSFSHGEGTWLIDEDGHRYLDALSGIAVCGLGHSHPAVTQALADQASKLMHTSNLYQIPLQEKLADRLCSISGMDRVFFGNSGAEANEAAIKLARRYGHHRGVENPHIVVMEGAFHGRTMATLTATGNRKVQAGFEPLVSGFIRVPFDDIDAVRQIAQHHHEVVAVLVEPVQGEGGVRIPHADYLDELRQVCDQHSWLLMLDEIQTGMGRSGRWFAFQHGQSEPDVITLAKSLGNGFPIGACLARGSAAEVFQPGNHGSTFGGNPLASRVGLAVVETIASEGLSSRAARMGSQLMDQIKTCLDPLGVVRDYRHKGLLLGIELDRDCSEIMRSALDERLLVNVTAGNVIRLLPPLTLRDEEASELTQRLTRTVERFLSQKAASK